MKGDGTSEVLAERLAGPAALTSGALLLPRDLPIPDPGLPCLA
jgi:hypothetical protein